MTEEAKVVAAVLAAVFAVMGIFILGLVLEPLAIVTGIIGATSKKVGIKATGIAAATIAGLLLLYLLLVLVMAANAANTLGY